MPSILTATKYAPVDHKSLFILILLPFWVDFALMHPLRCLDFMWTNKRFFELRIASISRLGEWLWEIDFSARMGSRFRIDVAGRLDEIRGDSDVVSKRCPQLDLEPNKVHSP
jgi:hypothetical protein